MAFGEVPFGRATGDFSQKGHLLIELTPDLGNDLGKPAKPTYRDEWEIFSGAS